MCEDYEVWHPVTTDSGELAAWNPDTGERRYGREALELLGQVRRMPEPVRPPWYRAAS